MNIKEFLAENFNIRSYADFLDLPPSERLYFYRNGLVPCEWAELYDRDQMIPDACEECP